MIPGLNTINRLNLITFGNDISLRGTIQLKMDYAILNVLTRANKVLFLSKYKLDKYNSANNINYSNFKHIGIGIDKIISENMKIYEPHFDFIVVDHWDPCFVLGDNYTNDITYFAFMGNLEPGTFSDSKSDLRVYSSDNMIIQDDNGLSDYKISEFISHIESDLRDYNISKIVN